jgi:hypothetical protein
VRRTLVWLAMLGALGVLALRLWPAPEVPRARPVIEATVPRPAVHLAGDFPDDVLCAAPAIQAIQKHPHWELTLQDRAWDDVAGDTPDETLSTVRITAERAVWTDGDLPQTVDLTAAERTDLLAAAQRSCVQSETPRATNYTGHYIAMSYGAVPATALRLPGRSPALHAVLAVLDRVRARYVQSRLATARTMTVTLAGPRHDGVRWQRYFLTVHPDGRVTDTEGDALEPLAAVDLVDVLDWALQLPAKVSTPRPLIGTLDIAGSKRPIALDLVELQTNPSVWRSPYLGALDRWGRVNVR